MQRKPSPLASDEGGTDASGGDRASASTLKPSTGTAGLPTSVGPVPESATDDESDLARTSAAAKQVATNKSGSGPLAPPAVQVETETVPSVPSLAVQTGGGSLRIKRSQDSVPRGNVKVKKRLSKLATASKADMFAAKVAYAVDEADSSDSDETFVYDANPVPQDLPRRPYLRTRSASSLPQSPRLHNRPSTLAGAGSGPPTLSATAVNTPTTQLPSFVPENHPGNPTNDQSSRSGSRSASPATSNRGRSSKTRKTSDSPQRRSFSRGPFVVSRTPSPAGYGSDRQLPSHADSLRAKNNYLNRWRSTVVTDGDGDDEDDYADSFRREGRLRPATESTPLRHMGSQYRNLARGSYGSYVNPSPHDFGRNAKPAPLYVRVTLWTMIALTCVLSFSFIFGLFLASSRPLQDTHIARIAEIVPSDKELVFSMVVGAKNPGYLSVQISDAELDIFATSKHVDKKKRTVLLGNVTELESPLLYRGTFFQHPNEWALAGVKMVTPCAGPNDEAACWQWGNISSHAFELTVRGSLRYRVLFGGEVKAPVSATVHVKAPETD